jgi:hypothetical protein
MIFYYKVVLNIKFFLYYEVIYKKPSSYNVTSWSARHAHGDLYTYGSPGCPVCDIAGSFDLLAEWLQGYAHDI